MQQLLGRSENRRWNLNQLAGPSHFGDISKWIEFFDWFGNSDKLQMRAWNRGEEAILWMEHFHRMFVADPIRTGLLRLLATLAIAGLKVPEMPKQLLDSLGPLDPRIQFSVMLIRLTWTSLEHAEAVQLAQKAACLLCMPAEVDAEALLFRTIEHHLDSVPSLEKFLIHIHGIMPAEVTFGRTRCEQLLRKCVRRRSSELKADGVLEDLDLPRLPRT